MSENRTERTEKINDGGQAFPQPLTFDAGGIAIAAYPGMSLRDWFAGQFAAQLVACTGGPSGTATTFDEFKSAVADASYRYADAMIAARSK